MGDALTKYVEVNTSYYILLKRRPRGKGSLKHQPGKEKPFTLKEVFMPCGIDFTGCNKVFIHRSKFSFNINVNVNKVYNCCEVKAQHDVELT